MLPTQSFSLAASPRCRSFGWHHIISTFTCFIGSSDSVARKRWLLLSILPVGFLVAAMAVSVGGWLVATVYLHWQWWHYTRQSEGIAKAYAGRAKRAGGVGYTQATRVALYAVAVWGIAAISARSPGVFLDMPVVTWHAPQSVVWGLGAFAMGAVAVWTGEQVVAWRRGTLFWDRRSTCSPTWVSSPSAGALYRR